MMRTTGCERRRSAVENSPHFLESKQIAIKCQRPSKIFHIEHDMAEVVCFHVIDSFPGDDVRSSALTAACASTTSGSRCNAS